MTAADPAASLLRSGTQSAIKRVMDARGKGTSGAITPAQVRAARGLLGWTLAQLIEASGVPKRTVIRFEASVGMPRKATIAAIQHALELVGVEFTNSDAPGVRLRKAAR
jgi:hypothetical protein